MTKFFSFSLLLILSTSLLVIPLTGQTNSSCDSDCSYENNNDNTIFKVTKECACCGDCSFCDALNVLQAITRFILGSMGGLALIFFAYGGIKLIISAGNTEQIAGAKKILGGTILGILIILFAWQLINIIIFLIISAGNSSLSISNLINVLGEPWAKVPCS